MTGTDRTDPAESQSEQSESRSERMEMQTDAVDGHRAVLAIVGLSVGVVSILGYAIGVFGPPTLDVGKIGPITFPVTPATLATYGLVMTGVVLGIFVVGVAGAVYYVNSKNDAA